MDRREFIVSSSKMLAAASCASLLSSCSESELNLPCLGPAAPPDAVPGMTYLWASKIGCALDCDLRNGRNKFSRGSATDDAPRINAALANASAANPITLILDGSALISGLFLPVRGYWNIAGLGCGTGFFVKSGSNSDGIHNGTANDTEPPAPGSAPERGSTVSLRNFTINGNPGNGRNGDSTSGSIQGVFNSTSATWFCAINLMNLDDVSVEKVVVVNSPSFQMAFSNVGNVRISGCVLRSDGRNTDGLHFYGPANDIAISDCDITSGDDAIALNCPEGYAGDISRVTVTDCKVNSGTFLMRLHPIDTVSGASFGIDTVSVRSCTGACAYAGILVGHGAGSKARAIDGLVVSNCSITAPAVLEIGANFGDIALENITFVPSSSSALPGLGFARSSAFSKGCSYSGSSLSLKSCIVQRHGGASVPLLDIQNGSSLAVLTANGYQVATTSESKMPMLVNVGSGTVGELTIDSVDSSHIADPVSSGAFQSIASVNGTGVFATGWEFPDEVMADGVPYLSATTGRPSIKINGVVEPYLPS